MRTIELAPMVRRDLLDFENEYTDAFLELKIADVAAELLLFMPQYSLQQDQSGNWEILPDPPYSFQRLLSIQTSIEIILFQVAVVKKIAEEIKEPGLSYSYKSSALALKAALEELFKKRDAIMTQLKSEAQINTSTYLSLTKLFEKREQVG